MPESAYTSEIESANFNSEITENAQTILDAETKTVGDPMVYLTQKWLNQEYRNVSGFGSVPENGKTGWDTVYGLLRALQHELGITSLADSFGPTTSNLYAKNPLSRQDGVTNRQFAILQGALWCKGYAPGYHLRENADGSVSFDEVFNADVERAVIALKTDAGFTNPNGTVTLNVMKALMSMDSFKLLSSYGGDAKIRSMQQKLNRKYEAYTGLNPCDGVYGRNTNKALIYALQAEEGLPTSVANGNFGNTTKLCCPNIPYAKNSSAARRYPGTASGSYYTATQISAMTEFLQFALYVNGFGDGVTDGIFDSETQQAVRNFQKKYAISQTGIADKGTWLSLFVSCGDTARSAKAADCATILTAAKAKSLYDNGYRYIGRYLTGTYNGGISKAITREEANLIFNAGLNFFPIYQTSARSEAYFTPAQGTEDAKAAIEAAANLGIPSNTIIYFAVDFDAMDYQITSNILPYFRKVSEVMKSSIYQTGIYGTRNACIRAAEAGYTVSSFVGDMSTGFSGNLGYSMPDNWAFDQFYTTSIGSGAGYLEIDKDGFSGRDYGVSKLNLPKTNTELPDITFGKSFSDELVGPMLDILGYKTPAFKLPFGFEINPKNLISFEDNLKEGTRQVTIGLGELNHEQYDDDPYEHLKELIESFDKSPSTASWNSLKGIMNNVKKLDFKVGFDASGSVLGFIKYDLATGAVKDSGLLIVADASVSARAPVYPLVFLKFQVEGNFTGTNIKLVLTEAGKIGPSGKINLSAKLKAGLELDMFLADAYAGVSGGIRCELKDLSNISDKSVDVSASFSLFMELGILLWGNSFEWTFADFQLLPHQAQNKIENYTISKDNLNFVEPINRVSTYSNTPDVFLPDVQTYCSPKIISLDDNKMIMLYIDDIPSRSAENRTTLMYSIFNGNSWSTPQPVSDDGTVDYAPEVYPDGNNGAHIIWQNAKSIFGSEVTLDEMLSGMEIQYIHWNGSSFDNAATLTDNSIYESRHKIASSGNNISVVWQENSENDPFGLNGTNQIGRKQFKNGTWQNTETIVSGLNAINSIDTAYIESNNVVTYSAKTNSDNSSMTDLEIFYFDGSTTRQLSNDDIPDYSVNLLDNELYWISNGSVVSVTNGNVDSKTTAITQLPDAVSEIKTLQNADGLKSIVWNQTDDTNVKIYGAYYNQMTAEFGAAIPLSAGDGVVRGWDATMMPDGNMELSYCAAEMLEEAVEGRPYGQLDLIQKPVDKFYDISVSQIITYDEEVLPGKQITLSADIYNAGSNDITQFDISVIAPDGNTIQTNTITKDLLVGKSANLEVPFTLPSEITKSEYILKITPHNGEDISLVNNEASFTIGYADLAIKEIEETQVGASRQLSITIINQGYAPADGAFKIIDGGPGQEVLSNTNVSQLNPGETINVTYNIDNSRLDSSISEAPLLFNLEIESVSEESNYINNNRVINVYPDYSVELNASAGGTVNGAGAYTYNSIAALTAIPEPGYIFAGWYENGKFLDSLTDEYSFTVLSNRTLEAKFIPNDLAIANIEIFGTLQNGNELTFTISTEGGYDPYKWEFKIYKNDELCYSNNVTVNFFEWLPTEAGAYSLVVNVTDASNFKKSYTKQFIIT